jgi:phosphate acyltransferase
MGTPTGGVRSIALDAMGSDLGPVEFVHAAKLALSDPLLTSRLVLVGQQDVLRVLVKDQGLEGHPRLTIEPASEIITMDDKPLQAIKRKKDSSMVRAIELVKSGSVGALLSCGNTGALMAGGTIKLRTLEGIDRPSLAAIIPRQNGFFVLIDAGANPDVDPRQLVHNALLGSHYARVLLKMAKPRVGLLTTGTEEGKGNALTNNTHALLKQSGGILNYVGPTEGFQVFSDHCDVAVCDGFTGNLLLKSWESLAKFFKSTLSAEIKVNPIRLAGGLLAGGAFAALKSRMNPDRYSGAPLLGLRGNILKAHGSSNRHALHSALLAADQILRADFLGQIEKDVAVLNALSVPTATSHTSVPFA